MNSEERSRMEYLQKTLKEASEAYYNGEEIMSNREWDELYDELVALEQSTGVVMNDSVTQSAGTEVVDGLETVTHEKPNLSLGKTKAANELRSQMEKNKDCDESVMMWKMDGSTVVATYDDGHLTRLATRGNGIVGNDITHNAPYIQGLPMDIDFKGHMIVRGEAVMTFEEFNRINDTIPAAEDKYQNPRNLANATIQLRDSNKMRTRQIQFYAFNNVLMLENGADIRPNEFSLRLKTLSDLGFQIVENQKISNTEIEQSVEEFTGRVNSLPYPVDGLVIASEDAAYAEKQPGTGRHPNNLVGYAFKWADELINTRLLEVEWSLGRTGLVTPVAIFEPVEICGTVVSRASMHNLSEMKRILGTPYKGQEINVFKANMIIPQVNDSVKLEDLDMPEGIISAGKVIHTPERCPCCYRPLTVDQSIVGTKSNQKIVEVLVCKEELCPTKQIGSIVHMAERDCLNIKGLSEEKVNFLVNNGYIYNRTALFKLAEIGNIYGTEHIRNDVGRRLIEEPGWGTTSVENLVDAIIKAQTTDFVAFIHSLGIPNVGQGQAKLLKNYIEQHIEELYPSFDYNNQTPLFEVFLQMLGDEFDFTKIDGFGEVINKSLYEFRNKYIGTSTELARSQDVLNIYDYLTFTDIIKNKEADKDAVDLTGKTFVVTGNVNYFKNRDELTAKIEELGGKCSGSVSSKTDYLINNDISSPSNKNQKAQALGVPIISEEDFLEMIGIKDISEDLDK